MPKHRSHAERETDQRTKEQLTTPGVGSLQVLLWMGWTGAVIGRAYVYLEVAHAHGGVLATCSIRSLVETEAQRSDNMRLGLTG